MALYRGAMELVDIDSPIATSQLPSFDLMDESEGDKPRLRYFEFVHHATTHIVNYVVKSYTTAKSRTGPLKIGVVILEKVVETIMGPIYDKIHEVPLQLLKRFDHKVGKVVDTSTELARKAVSRVQHEMDVRFENLECTLHERFSQVDQRVSQLFNCMNDWWMQIDNRIAMIDEKNLEDEVIEAQFSDPRFVLGIQPIDIWKKGKLIRGGNLAIVYKGVHRHSGALCAIKVIRNPIDRRSSKNFQREINILEMVPQHQNIVRYYDCMEIQGEMHIFLEYVHPGPISKFRERNGVMNEAIVQNFTRQILTGLKHLHANNVIHRDIRGDNIQVDMQGVVKIADFTLATPVKEFYSDQEMSYYTAPEILEGHGNYSTPIDIWSLGCTVIEMFTGQNAWPRNEFGQRFFELMVPNQQYPPIPENLSPNGKKFLERCFERDPKKRPTAKELLEDIFIK